MPTPLKRSHPFERQHFWQEGVSLYKMASTGLKIMYYGSQEV